jgi:hypothetical protein
MCAGKLNYVVAPDNCIVTPDTEYSHIPKSFQQLPKFSNLYRSHIFLEIFGSRFFDFLILFYKFYRFNSFQKIFDSARDNINYYLLFFKQ